MDDTTRCADCNQTAAEIDGPYPFLPIVAMRWRPEPVSEPLCLECARRRMARLKEEE